MAIFHSRQRRYQFGNACVRLRSDFQKLKKQGMLPFTLFREVSIPCFFNFENHLARPKTAHFQTDTAADVCEKWPYRSVCLFAGVTDVERC